MRKQRRKPTFDERQTPCQCCQYPISHRHHLLEIRDYGENEITVQLCANCHELYHLIKEERYKRVKLGGKTIMVNLNNALVAGVMNIHIERCNYLRDLVAEAQSIESEVLEKLREKNG